MQNWRGNDSGINSQGVQKWHRFPFLEMWMPEPVIDTDDLALDWGNTLFVVGVSMAVVAAVLFAYPYLRARLSGTKEEK